MPELINKSTSGAWSRNLRTLGRCSTESDSSSSGSPPNPPNQQQPSAIHRPALLSEDSRLIQQMDLASRRDEAVYKPNPWSIAKMNAASRPPQQQDKLNLEQNLLNSKKRPQGQIVDGFKRQFEKSQARLTSKPPPKKPSAPCNRSTPFSGVAKQPECHRATSSTPLPQSMPHTSSRDSAHVSPSAPQPFESLVHGSSHTKREPPLRPSALALHQHIPGHLAHTIVVGPLDALAVEHQRTAKVKESLSSRTERSWSAAHSSHPVRVAQRPGSLSGLGHKVWPPPNPAFSRDVMSSPIYAPSKSSGPGFRPETTRHTLSSPPRAPPCHGLSDRSFSRKRPLDFVMGGLQSAPMRESTAPSNLKSAHNGLQTYSTPLVAQKSTPPPSSMRLAPPDTPVTKNIPRQPSSGRRDSYDLCSPGADWSTLPPKKNLDNSKKSRRPDKVTSSKFRLPLATSTLAQAEPDAKRRRVSYLPPPPQKFAFHKRPSQDAETRNPVRWKITRVTAGQMPEKLIRDDRPNVANATSTRPLQNGGPSTSQMRRNYPSPPHCQSSPSSDSIPLPLPPLTVWSSSEGYVNKDQLTFAS
ncbi:hypothetical protein BDY19DRAFT_994222 [Irpex rosettiformis]|uniref:Uncharacterized protein n=1 Tax=Irpex rosettiformis TaxID=378272 RepID=A0ACB8U2L0_9APHY|nr:hypothetical protein BDY19DRAFT_994222 [Irpex rosettiformis]